MEHLTEYKISAQLAQAIVNTLNELPSRVTRGLLNELDANFTAQDVAHAKALEEKKLADLKASLLKEGNGDGPVHEA